MNIAVFASGRGSNLQALIDAQNAGELAGGRIVLVLSDNPEAPALEKARAAGIETFLLPAGPGMTRHRSDNVAVEQLAERGVELVVLAGYMRLLSDEFVDRYKGRVINIHPSLLPAFKGLHGIRDAYEHGVKITGVTVHFVDRKLDNGPVIAQKAVPVLQEDTIQSLEERIHKAEHSIYPEVIRFYVEGRITVRGRKVTVKND
ncbi:MAG: phosphoribosylglycinamide formyltransferase [Candidatus Omnitrophica bacterium]|nr:phosphoribosylglycinamide formyltransferase [Candidatus Omnitrophota bacterium]